MELAALIISIFALGVSIWVAFFEGRRDYKINRINLESVYFKEIYTEHLVTKIPKARNYIYFNQDNQLSGTKNLINELKELRRDSLYFQYHSKSFYDELNDTIQSLEDYLVANTKKVFVGEVRDEFMESLHNMIEDMYSIISEGYLGKYFSLK